MHPIRWGRAMVLAGIAVYGPYVAMGFYALVNVDCRHCRTTVWQLLAIGPGLVTIQMLNLAFRLPRLHLPDWALMGMAAGISALLLLAVATLLRECGRWRKAVLAAAAVWFGLGAAMLLAMIRA